MCVCFPRNGKKPSRVVTAAVGGFHDLMSHDFDVLGLGRLGLIFSA